MRDGGDEECVEKRVYYRIVSGESKHPSKLLVGGEDEKRDETRRNET